MLFFGFFTTALSTEVALPIERVLVNLGLDGFILLQRALIVENLPTFARTQQKRIFVYYLS
jgi:hypothetical protein